MNEAFTRQELIAYYWFGGSADERKLLKDEADEFLSQIFERKVHEASDRNSGRLQHAAGSAGLYPESPSALCPHQKYRRISREQTSPENSARVGIDEFYTDPMLLCLIDQALSPVGNRELKILNEEVQIARNEILARSGAYLPFVSAGGGAGLNRYQPLHGRRSRHTRRPVSPREAFYQSVWKFRVGCQPYLAARHLPAVAECPRRGSAALRRRQ